MATVGVKGLILSSVGQSQCLFLFGTRQQLKCLGTIFVVVIIVAAVEAFPPSGVVSAVVLDGVASTM